MKKSIVLMAISFACFLLLHLISLNVSFSQSKTVNVSGTYSTEWGKMILIQQGNLVTGNYEHDNGILEGTLTGNVITGKWKEDPTKEPPFDAGLLKFEFNESMTTFTGYWKYGFDEMSEWSGSWVGTKSDENVIKIGGVYDTDWGELKLLQDGKKISGVYTHDDGKIEGIINGNEISGKWFEAPTYDQPDDAGLFLFRFSEDLNSFTGNWKYGFSEGSLDQGAWNGTKRIENMENK